MAYQALNLAHSVDQAVKSHEAICAERYAGIHSAIKDIKAVLWKAGAGAFGIILSMLAYLVVQQIATNDKLHDERESAIRALQQQLSDERMVRAAENRR